MWETAVKFLNFCPQNSSQGMLFCSKSWQCSPWSFHRPAFTACGVSRSLLFTWSPRKVRASRRAPALTLWIRKPLQQDSDCRNQLFYPASQLEGQNTQTQKHQSVMKAGRPRVLPAVNEFPESWNAHVHWWPLNITNKEFGEGSSHECQNLFSFHLWRPTCLLLERPSC